MKPKNTVGPKAGINQFDYLIKNEQENSESKLGKTSQKDNKPFEHKSNRLDNNTVSFGLKKEADKKDETSRQTEEEKKQDENIGVEEEQWVLQAET